jgi:hypothetical protein
MDQQDVLQVLVAEYIGWQTPNIVDSAIHTAYPRRFFGACFDSSIEAPVWGSHVKAGWDFLKFISGDNHCTR